MGQHTYIQWCDTTCNVSTGCPGCELWAWLESLGKATGPCYAGKLHEGRLALSMPKLYDREFTKVRLAPGRIAKTARLSDLRGKDRPDKPWLNGMPRLVFLGDMGDMLAEEIPFEYLADEVIGAITSPQGARHIWQILTKRPRRLAEFASWLLNMRGVDWPENIWSGTSVTSQAQMGRVEHLRCVPGVRFISFEPLWGQVTLPIDPIPKHREHWPTEIHKKWWVIIGGQSDQPGHPAKPMDLAWVRKTLGDCQRAGVPAFLKQWGSHPVANRSEVYDFLETVECEAPARQEDPWRIHLKDSHGGNWNEWPETYRIRQMPGMGQPQA